MTGRPEGLWTTATAGPVCVETVDFLREFFEKWGDLP